MFTHTKHGIALAAAAAALALALAGCSALSDDEGVDSGAGTDTSTAAPETEATASAAPPAEEPQTPGLNMPLTVGTFEFTALAAKDVGTTAGSSILSATAQGSFFQVDLRIANTGNAPETFFVQNVQLQDAAGNTYDADSTATVYASADASTWISAINPGNALEGPILFDLPVGTKPVTLLVSDSMFGQGQPITIG